MRRNDLFGFAAERLVAAPAGQRFQSAVPADDPSFDVFDHHADVDRFNDVFAEILQALIFRRLLLERTVQARILERDADVIRHRFQQLQVFARQVIAVLRSSQPDVRDHAILHPARNEVVQVVKIILEKDVRPVRR